MTAPAGTPQAPLIATAGSAAPVPPTAGEGEAAVVPAPALPVWPPPTNPAGRRDEPSPGSPGVAPRPSSRPGLLPASGTSTAAGSGPDATRPLAGAERPTERAGMSPAVTEQSARRPGGSDLSAYYAGTESSATVAFPTAEQENSGSLTGHILAQGWTDSAAERSSSMVRVVIMMAIALGLLVAISVLVVLFANDALSGASSGLLG